MPMRELRRNVPSVEGARTSPISRAIPPERSRSRSSIESAPASMAEITDRAVISALGAHRIWV